MITSRLLDKINRVINENTYSKNKEDILVWLKDEKLGKYFLDKLPKEFENLNEIDFLLEELIRAHNSFVAIDFLEKNINEKNNKYIFQFLNKHIKFLLEKDNDTFGNHSAEIVKKILEKYPEESDDSFSFVQKFIKVHPDNFEDMRTMREFGKQMISDIIFNLFEIWKREKKNESIEKLVDLVGKKFNLIDDDYKFSMFTPEKLFLMLYEYVIMDFENNFKKVVEMAVNQFKDKRIGYGKEYHGQEWSASGISRSGKFYSITDRHIVEKVLAPAAKHFYENAEDKDASWEKIRELCFVPEKEISPEKPDLLNRAIIPIALERYAKLKGKKKENALNVLESLIDMTSLPDKGHIIFQEVARSDMSDADKWRIIEVSLNAKWNKKKLPADVFVEQIVSGLTKKGDKKEEAKALLEKWSKDEEYLKRQGFGEYDLLGVISGLLTEEDKSEGIKLFEEYIYSSAFKGKLERFDAFDVADKLAGILDRNCDKGIEILWKIYKQDKLTENEQILICSGINKITKPDIRIRIYREFLKKILDDLNGDIDKIVAKFDKDYPRTAIVEFGDELAKEKKFAEALNIAKIFINDPDPRINDKEDNLHEQIKKGEEESSITSVRGWVCWLLHQFPILEGRDYIPETIPLIKKLSQDLNYYVRSQTCFPLAELMRVRNSVMPGTDEDKKEWFLARDDARKIENIAFDMLGDEENQKLKAVMINLAFVFNYMRSMDTSQAVEVLNVFKNSEFTEPLEKIASSYIFYAEFRKNAFKGKLWEDLAQFDDKPIKELLIDFLRNGKKESRRTLLWQFMGLIGESKKSPHFSYDEAFSIAYKYIKIISEKYDPEIFTHIFRFIKENMGQKYEDCRDFFITCLKKEQEALKSEKIDKTWLPFYYHRDILEEIFKKGEKEMFLSAFEIIADYSPKYSHWDELRGLANHLIDYPKNDKGVGKIFDKLIENNPAYYDIKVKWMGE